MFGYSEIKFLNQTSWDTIYTYFVHHCFDRLADYMHQSVIFNTTVTNLLYRNISNIS